jgi:small-conductance mechanosensitive channel
MDIRSITNSAIASNFTLARLVETSLQVIFIAIVFEFLAWWLGRRIESWVTPLLPHDSGREQGWRTRRRLTLRQTPKLIARTTCYTAALLLVLNVFNVPILPLAIALGAVALLFGAALMPLMRDAAQGYALLADDVLAPGDVVEVEGKRGVVEKFTLRGLWLRDEEKRIHFFANRGVADVTMVARRQEAAPAPAFDPLSPSANGPQASGAAKKPPVST